MQGRKETNKIIPACLLPALFLLWSGCSHDPVYPEIGDAIIDSRPRGAEVLIDGASTHLMTPCRVSGVPVGARRLTLCYNNYRTLNADIAIKPGQVARLHYTMAPIVVKRLVDMSLGWYVASGLSVDHENNDVYVATNAAQVQRYHVGDSSLVRMPGIDALGPQLALEVSSRNGRLFYVCRAGSDTVLVCADMNTGLVIRKHVQPDNSRYVKLALSPDGDVLLAADSLGRRLLAVDARSGAIVKSVPLSGLPSDVVFGDLPGEAYVTLCGSRRLARVDLSAGEEREWAPTGNNPRSLFWSPDRGQLGCCNATDKQLTIVDLGNWAGATAMDPGIGGDGFPAACWTDEPFYLMVLIDGGHPSGVLNTVFARNWLTASKLSLGSKPLDIDRMPALKRYILLTRDSLHLVKGEFR